MTAHDYLNQIKTLNESIKSKLLYIGKLKNEAQGTSVKLEGERVQSSGSKQKMANTVVKYVHIEQTELQDLRDRRQAILDTMAMLPILEHDVLFKYYVLGYELKDIAKVYKKSYQWARDKRKHALKLLQRILDERKENE